MVMVPPLRIGFFINDSCHLVGCINGLNFATHLTIRRGNPSWLPGSETAGVIPRGYPTAVRWQP